MNSCLYSLLGIFLHGSEFQCIQKEQPFGAHSKASPEEEVEGFIACLNTRFSKSSLLKDKSRFRVCLDHHLPCSDHNLASSFSDKAYFLITFDPTSIYIHFVDCCPQEKLTDYFISLETFALTWKFSIRPTNQCRQSANENPRVTNLPQLKSSKSRRVDQRGGGKYLQKALSFHSMIKAYDDHCLLEKSHVSAPWFVIVEETAMVKRNKHETSAILPKDLILTTLGISM